MIKYPQMRNELIINIRALADPVYQRRVWVNLERPLAHYEDSFASVIHFIFDDMSLDTHLKQAIGDILDDESEVEAVKEVVEAVNKVLDSGSSNTTDQEYIESL